VTALLRDRTRGRLAVVGLGPGAGGWMMPDVRAALSAAEDIVGYASYLRMAGPFRPDQTIHSSDNREEMDRARLALALAAGGRSVAVVSSGDPGIFAMASAVMEALHRSDDPAWHGVELVVIPGISAAHAAAARAGAPLGHDFCVLSLSDNLKPWAVIERRLALAAAADLALALYNPVSRARPWQLGRAVEIVRGYRAPETPVVLGRDIGRPGETVRILTLAELSPADADMRTVVIIGSSTTQAFPRSDGGMWVYTPRSYGTPTPPVSEPAGSPTRQLPR
jgi:cobalt-precorrin 5A hydrolase / precorrin-3B C17-methyltransferase